MLKFFSGLAISSALLLSQTASAHTLLDNFYGGNAVKETEGIQSPLTDRDIVGTEGGFEVSKIESNVSTANIITIDIYSRFLNNINLINQGLNSDGTYRRPDMLLGDLLLSTDGWNPFGNASDFYSDDDASNGEDWEYAIVLDNHWGNDSPDNRNIDGNAYIYAVSSSNYIFSQDYLPNEWATEYRYNQEVQYSDNPENNLTTSYPSSWAIIGLGTTSDLDDFLRISFSLDDLNLTTIPDELGVHWTMSCGNDVIEGLIPTTPTPEPTTMLLFGTGIIGIAGLRKRIRK